MDSTWARLASDLSGSSLTLWLGGSLLLYSFGANVLWFLRNWLQRPYGRWLHQAGRFLFYLAVPYAALGGWPQRPYQGLLSLDDMGIVGLSERWPVTRWLESAGVGLGWGLVALMMMVLAWAIANRRSSDTSLRAAPARGWAVLVNVLYLQVHWAFYRGALAVILNDVYTGVFLGLGLVYVEWGLNPFWRRDWRRASRAAEPWLRSSLALAIALLFLLSRNWWVCLAVHLLVEFSVRQADRQRTLSDAAAPSAQQAEALTAE